MQRKAPLQNHGLTLKGEVYDEEDQLKASVSEV